MLGIFYVGKMGGSLCSNIVCSKIGRQKTFAIGSFFLGMVIYTEIISAWKADNEIKGLDFIFSDSTIELFMIIGNILAGVGAAFIWVAQGEYISLCSTENTRGFLFGYFWVWNKMAEVFGNLAGAVTISRMSQHNFFILMSGLMLVPSLLFLFLRNPKASY